MMMAPFRYSIPLFFATISGFSTFVQAQPRIPQRLLQVYELSEDVTQSLCRMTDSHRLRTLLTPLLVPRVVNTESHKRVALYLKRTLDGLGFTTEWDRFSERTPFGQKTFRNLVATFDPNAPRRLVLACHYDSKVLRGVEFIGATDSAVPCAMLLDLATTLAPLLHHRSNREVTLQLVFFDGEEAFVEWTPTDSIYGARHLANLWSETWIPHSDGSNFDVRREIDRIDVLVLLDLLGAANPHISNTYGHNANDLFTAFPRIEANLKQLNCLHDLPAIFKGQMTYNAVEDDHVPFLARGVPVMHLIPVPFPRVWHTVADDASALHYPTIDNLLSIVRVFVGKYLGLTP